MLATPNLPESSISDTLVAKLLAAADRYSLGRLRLLCEAHLCREISVNSVASTLALADRCHAIELKAACLKFVAENLSGILLPTSYVFYLYCYHMFFSAILLAYELFPIISMLKV